MPRKKLRSLLDMAGKRIKFVVIAIDQTELWSEDIQKKANGKIDTVYLVDLTKPTHLCELAVSFPAEFISNYFHNIDAWRKGDEVDDQLTELERNNGDEQVTYFRGYNEYYPKKFYYTGTLEDAMENERCNPTVC